MPLPLKLFEVQDVVLTDATAEVGARNERRIGAVNCNKSAGFEIVHGLLDRVMQLLEVPWKGDNGYSLQKAEGYETQMTKLFETQILTNLFIYRSSLFSRSLCEHSL